MRSVSSRWSARRRWLPVRTLMVLALALSAVSSVSAASVSAASASAGQAASGAPAATARLVTAAAAAAAAAAPGRTAGNGIPSASATVSSDVANLGARGWQVHSSAGVTRRGARSSSPGFHPRGWLRVSNDDAGAPGTEIEALLQNGRCPHVFFSDNMRKCFGFEDRIGKDTVARFAVPWWWRTGFAVPARAGRDAKLIINGVIGAANVWVNGHKVAGAARVTGADPLRSALIKLGYSPPNATSPRPAFTVAYAATITELDPAVLCTTRSMSSLDMDASSSLIFIFGARFLISSIKCLWR